MSSICLRIGFVAVLAFMASRVDASSPDCSAHALPPSVAVAVQESFKDWRIKTLEDFDDDDRNIWMQAKPQSCPGIAAGHFVNSKARDYALLLIPKNAEDAEYKVVVFAQKESELQSTIIESATVMPKRMAISHVPPGKYSDAEGSSATRIKMDGVLVEALEAGSIIYYWSSGRFQKIFSSE